MINISKIKKQMDDSTQRIALPLLPLRDVVVFPNMVVPLFVGRSKSVNALSNAMNLDKRIMLATQKNAGVDSPGEKDIYMIGTIGTVLQLLRLPDGTVKALVEGKKRGRIVRFGEREKYTLVEVEPRSTRAFQRIS
jgi:ATP-dependent Lon protease